MDKYDQIYTYVWAYVHSICAHDVYVLHVYLPELPYKNPYKKYKTHISPKLKIPSLLPEFSSRGTRHPETWTRRRSRGFADAAIFALSSSAKASK